MSATLWDITLSGSFRVVCAGKELTHFRTRKVAALLAYLAFDPDRPLRRDEISEQLWPDHDPEAARNLLRVTLTHLRKALESDPGADSPLVTDRDHVRLRPEALRTDRRQFEELLDKANRATDADEKLSLLRQAEGLYCGNLLPEMNEEWIVCERQRWNDAYLIVLRQIIKALAAVRSFDLAQAYARKALAIDPYREESHRTLMKLFVMSGRVEAALRQYEELTRLLATELRAQPSAVTTALLREIQSLDNSASASLPPGPPCPNPRKLPNSLPSRLPPLFGREEDLVRLQEMLATPETPLITLTGLGGAGKTRLAIATAHQATARFGEEIYFVPLAALAQGNQIPDAILSALPVERHPSLPALEQVVSFFANREALLIMDNCEHLLRPGAAVIQTLVEAAPTLICLVTSRERLRLRCEYEYAVRMLPTPLPTDPLQIVASSASVQMFVERARHARPDFEVTTANAMPVAQICRWLEGLPLSIELAAARIRTLTPTQILERIKPRFALLATDQQDFPARHTSLRAALDWSYGLLTDQEKLLLCRISVFVGGWSLEAVEMVGAGETGGAETIEEWEVLDLLSSLVDKSLVIAEIQAEATRYRLLETVRQYARDRLMEREDNVSVRARHRDYFLTLAERAEPQLTGTEQAKWLNVLEDEHDNLRLALTYCLDEPLGVEKGLRLGAAMQQFWWTRGYLSEGRLHLAALLARSTNANQDHQKPRARALNGAGTLACMQGDYTAARALFEENLTIQRELGEKRGIAKSLCNLGKVAHDQGDYLTARDLYAESLTLFKETGHKRGIADALVALSILVREQGDYPSARTMLEESLTLYQQLEYKTGITVSLTNLGNVVREQGEDTTARALFEESLTICRELGDKRGIGFCLLNLGNVAVMQGNYTRAHDLYDESLTIWRTVGDKHGISLCLLNLGTVAYCQGDYTAAQVLYDENLKIVRALGDMRGIAVALDVNGNLQHQKQQEGRATQLWAAATALRDTVGSPRQPEERETYETATEQARSVLGDTAFDAAFAEGHAMTWEQAVAFALRTNEL